MPHAAAGYQIDDLQVDVLTRRVLRDGVDLGVTSLSFDLLLALARASPALLTFDALMEQVWPGVVVGPETLTQRVKLLRQALGDSAENPRYILAVRGHGYRLQAAAVALPAMQPSSPPAPDSRSGPRWWQAGGVLLIVAALAWWLFAPRHAAQSESTQAGARAEAYQYFLQAESVVNGTPESFRAAIALYDEALALDPDFGKALSGRAMNRAALVWVGSPLGRGLEDAQRDATRALELDAADARAHVVLASVSALRGQWSAADQSFQAAIKASPQDADVLGRYAATLLLPTGQLHQAQAIATQAQGLTPAGSFQSAILAFADQALGADAAALQAAQLSESRGGDPRQMAPVYASAAARAGRYSEAAAHAIKVLPPAVRDTGAEEVLRQAYAALDNPQQRPAALAALRRMTSEPAWERADPRSRQPVLDLFAAMGAMDELYDQMNRMLRGEVYPQIIAIGSMWSPQMRPFRRDRRFQELVERLGLMEYWKQSGPPDGCVLSGTNLTCS